MNCARVPCVCVWNVFIAENRYFSMYALITANISLGHRNREPESIIIRISIRSACIIPTNFSYITNSSHQQYEIGPQNSAQHFLLASWTLFYIIFCSPVRMAGELVTVVYNNMLWMYDTCHLYIVWVMDFDLTHPFKERARESGITPTPLLGVHRKSCWWHSEHDECWRAHSVRNDKKNRFAYFY